MSVATAFITFAMTIAGFADVESRELGIPTRRGPKLVARITRPAEGQPPFPALVIAPGKSFDMDHLAFDRISTRAAERGFLVLRFNWDFYTRKKKRSPRFVNEVQDLKTAITYLRSLPSANNEQIFVLGKSIGARVAAELASRSEPLAGLILLTPPIHSPTDPDRERSTADFMREIKLPLLLIGADRDNHCSSDALKQLSEDVPSNPEVIIVAGDHQLECATDQEAEQSVERIAAEVADWISRQLSKTD